MKKALLLILLVAIGIGCFAETKPTPAPTTGSNTDFCIVILKMDRGNSGTSLSASDMFLPKGITIVDTGYGKFDQVKILDMALFISGMREQGYDLMSQSSFVDSNNGVYINYYFAKPKK